MSLVSQRFKCPSDCLEPPTDCETLKKGNFYLVNSPILHSSRYSTPTCNQEDFIKAPTHREILSNRVCGNKRHHHAGVCTITEGHSLICSRILLIPHLSVMLATECTLLSNHPLHPKDPGPCNPAPSFQRRASMGRFRGQSRRYTAPCWRVVGARPL